MVKETNVMPQASLQETGPPDPAGLAGNGDAVDGLAMTGPDGVATPGLQNRLGEYNCFLNCVVQCLWHCTEFSDRLQCWDAAELQVLRFWLG